MVSQADLVSHFHLHDEETQVSSHVSQEEKYADYLATYSSDALSKPELLDQMMRDIRKYYDYKYVFQVKRAGADLDKWYKEIATDIWSVQFEDSRKAAYSIGTAHIKVVATRCLTSIRTEITSK